MSLSPTWTFFDGAWHEGNPPIMGPRSHAFWLGSSVFDGARYFDGVMPDLDRHFERVNHSAKTMYLKPEVSVDQWIALTKDGIKKFSSDKALYIKPMYWPESGLRGEVARLLAQRHRLLGAASALIGPPTHLQAVRKGSGVRGKGYHASTCLCRKCGRSIIDRGADPAWTRGDDKKFYLLAPLR